MDIGGFTESESKFSCIQVTLVAAGFEEQYLKRLRMAVILNGPRQSRAILNSIPFLFERPTQTCPKVQQNYAVTTQCYIKVRKNPQGSLRSLQVYKMAVIEDLAVESTYSGLSSKMAVITLPLP